MITARLPQIQRNVLHKYFCKEFTYFGAQLLKHRPISYRSHTSATCDGSGFKSYAPM